MNLSAEASKAAPSCPVCLKAEKMGGAIRCMACGRWVPRVDRRRSAGSGQREGVLQQVEAASSCPQCRPDEQRPRVTITLPYRVFFKCDRCLSVWSVDTQRHT